MSDIGSTFEGRELTRAEYDRVERSYLRAIRLFMRDTEATTFLARDLDRTPETEKEDEWVHDGLVVGRAKALEICRLVLRERLVCRLEDEGKLHISFGFDYYVHLGALAPCDAAINEVVKLGLNVEIGDCIGYED
jgi:hypothetical protein